MTVSTEDARHQLEERNAWIQRHVDDLRRQRDAIEGALREHEVRQGEVQLLLGMLCGTGPISNSPMTSLNNPLVLGLGVPMTGGESGAESADERHRTNVRALVREWFETHDLPISDEDLARQLGIRTRSIDLSLENWAKKGLIEKRADGLWRRVGHDLTEENIVPLVEQIMEGRSDRGAAEDNAEQGGTEPLDVAAHDEGLRARAQQDVMDPSTPPPPPEVTVEAIEHLKDTLSAWPGEGMSMQQLVDHGIPETVVNAAGRKGQVGVKSYGSSLIYMLPNTMAAN